MPDFRALFEAAPGAYLVLRPDFTIAAVSGAYLAATMTRREDVIGRHLFDVFPDNPAEAGATGVANLRSSLERVLELRRADAMAVQKYDIRRPDADGGGFEERHWSPVNSPVLGADGNVAYIIHRVEDVTEFVRLKLRDSERDEIAQALRTRAGEMEAEIFRRAQELQRTNERLRELQAQLETRVAERTADLQGANDALKREIDEHRLTEEALARSEEQLRQSQKMEAIGLLAGGISHDFNNLLSVILSYSEMMLEPLLEGAPGRRELEEIKRAGERAAELTRQLLAFSRQQVLEPRILDLNSVVKESSRMLARILGEQVEIRLALANDLGKVRADPGQIEQVLVNLVVNARDAMPKGGRLTIGTADVELDAGYAHEHLGVEPGRYVALTVTDTGIGMDKATQARVFEPFFTTKERGKGTGLGLSTVFGIVKQSGGNLWLYSEPGVGTTFKVHLPRVEGAAASAVRSAPAPLARGTETILLVEDEEQIRGVARRILASAGYRVIETKDAVEALRTVEEKRTRVDLLLTDVIMPRLSGRELAERVCAAQPGVKVLFMSGYTDDAILHHGVQCSDFAFLQKPLTPTALCRKVRDVLDAR